MKYVLLAILVMPLIGISQITSIKKANVKEEEIGSINQMGWKSIKLKKITAESDDPHYILVFKDERYRQLSVYKSISFNEEDGVLDTLYSTLKSAIEAEDKFEMNFNLGKNSVLVKTYKSMGSTTIWFVLDNGMFTLNRRQLDKLFGKK